MIVVSGGPPPPGTTMLHAPQADDSRVTMAVVVTHGPIVGGRPRRHVRQYLPNPLLMALTPGYGETPVSDDDLIALQPELRAALGDEITKATIYDIEQSIQGRVTEELLESVAAGETTVDEMLTDGFIRDLHRRL